MHETFEAMYSQSGRPSIPPERLLKAQILIALFTVRSDRGFCEQLDFNLPFRWFLDMEIGRAGLRRLDVLEESEAPDRQRDWADVSGLGG